MSCTAAEETGEYTPALIDLLGLVNVRFRSTAYGTWANGPCPNAFHLGSWCSFITCKIMFTGDRDVHHLARCLAVEPVGDPIPTFRIVAGLPSAGKRTASQALRRVDYISIPLAFELAIGRDYLKGKSTRRSGRGFSKDGANCNRIAA